MIYEREIHVRLIVQSVSLFYNNQIIKQPIADWKETKDILS